jgi:hypothetical protein
MIKRIRLCLMVGLAVVAIAAGSWAVPKVVNMQGRVTKGGVIQQNALIIFTPTTSKTPLGTAMTDVNGIFNATLDFSLNYTNFPGTYSVRVYLGTTDDPNLIGTQVFNSVPYAFRAERAAVAESVVGGVFWTGTTDISNINTGNVGIGTATPASKLEVNEANSTGNQLTVSSGGGSKIAGINLKIDATDLWQIQTDNNRGPNNLFLRYNNAYDVMTVDTVGNVCIGTASPLEHLQIGDRFTFHDGGDKLIAYNQYWRQTLGSRRIVPGPAEAIRFTSTGDLKFQTAGSGVADSTVTWTDALTVNNNGNVDIGGKVSAGNSDSGFKVKIFKAINLAGGASSQSWSLGTNKAIYSITGAYRNVNSPTYWWPHDFDIRYKSDDGMVTVFNNTTYIRDINVVVIYSD